MDANKIETTTLVWQSMENAPRDGSYFLIHIPEEMKPGECPEGSLFFARWQAVHGRWADNASWTLYWAPDDPDMLRMVWAHWPMASDAIDDSTPPDSVGTGPHVAFTRRLAIVCVTYECLASFLRGNSLDAISDLPDDARVVGITRDTPAPHPYRIGVYIESVTFEIVPPGHDIPWIDVTLRKKEDVLGGNEEVEDPALTSEEYAKLDECLIHVGSNLRKQVPTPFELSAIVQGWRDRLRRIISR